jgi:hypothetical protein
VQILVLAKRDRKEKVIYENYVAQVTKKRENRIIAVIASRLFICKPLAKAGIGVVHHTREIGPPNFVGMPAPVVFESHLLELKEINATAHDDEITLVSRSGATITIAAPKVDRIVEVIRTLWLKSFPSTKEPFKVNLPEKRLAEIPAAPRLPCKGFGATYAAMCDMYGVRVRNDLVWDFNNIFGPKNIVAHALAPVTCADPLCAHSASSMSASLTVWSRAIFVR